MRREDDVAQRDFASYADFYRRSSYAAFRHEFRGGGSFGLNMLQVEQGPHDFTDRGTPDLLIGIRQKIDPTKSARYHLGDRWIDIDTRIPLTVVAPARVDVDYDIRGDNSLLILALPMDALCQAIGADDLQTRLEPVYQTPFFDPLLFELAHRLWREAIRNRAMSLLLDSGVLAIVALLLGRTERGALRDKVKAGGERLVRRIAAYVDAHLQDDIRLVELAAAANLSPTHFARAFKAETGQTPHGYVVERRIARSRALLGDRDLPLSQIAYACGFANQSHFTTVFRHHTGATPAVFRQATLQ